MTDPNGVVIPMPRCAARYNLGVDQWAICHWCGEIRDAITGRSLQIGTKPSEEAS